MTSLHKSEIMSEKNPSFVSNISDLFNNMSLNTRNSYSTSSLKNILIQNAKSPFLPKLPKKTTSSRQNDSHLINDYYVEPNILRNKNKSILARKLKIDFKGDLLKASQIYLALNSNMSGSIKHVKTSDTPWGKNMPMNGMKPCKSVLSKNRVETASFTRATKSRTSNQSFRTGSSNHSNQGSNYSCNKSSTFSNKFSTDLEQNQIKLERFAEDLLVEHYKKSLYNKEQSETEKVEYLKKNDPDVALHVYNKIWAFHSFALKNSPFLKEIFENQSNLAETSEIKVKIKESKENTRTNIGKEYLNKMVHLLITIDDPLIDNHSLAIALGNLYHPDQIEVPSKLAGGVLSAAYLLKFDNLINGVIDQISHSLSKKAISYYYTSAIKNDCKRAIDLCEKWLEIHLIPCLGSSIYLRDIPLNLLTKTIKSSRLFAVNEYDTYMTIINWIFLNMNPQIKELPTESMIITFFSSFGKDKTLIERYPELKDVLFAVRFYGITKSNNLHTIQQMNIYPNSYIVKIMMEIQQSFSRGGDMLVNRLFETSALRQGFVIEIDQNYYSEVFSLYGFHFELIAEKVRTEENQKISFQFYIQRLSTNDPILTYEQSQLETFSLRNDRLCNYSINVQYWYDGNSVFETTGLKKQRFGKAKTQTTPSFYVNFPVESTHDHLNEIYVQYSFTFPAD